MTAYRHRQQQCTLYCMRIFRFQVPTQGIASLVRLTVDRREGSVMHELAEYMYHNISGLKISTLSFLTWQLQHAEWTLILLCSCVCACSCYVHYTVEIIFCTVSSWSYSMMMVDCTIDWLIDWWSRPSLFHGTDRNGTDLERTPNYACSVLRAQSVWHFTSVRFVATTSWDVCTSFSELHFTSAYFRNCWNPQSSPRREAVHSATV